MSRFNFYNIHGLDWLNVSILAPSPAAAVRRFNEMMGQGVRYEMGQGGPLNGTFKLSQVIS